jgi:undecaprenyl-phosphate 4-deoxy-4-formamido-L-arabinose transferase
MDPVFREQNGNLLLAVAARRETRLVGDPQGLLPRSLLAPAERLEATLDGMQGISVVVPVYNSAPTLGPLLCRLRDVLSSLGLPYEAILVNDGSRDASWQQIEALARDYPELRGFNLMRNYGQHNALLCGIREARYDVIVTIDDDLQNPPEEIPLLLKKLAEGHDVVYGTPATANHGLLRNTASWLTKVVLHGMMGAANAKSVSSFRAFRTNVRDAFAHFSSPNVSIDVLLTWGTSRFASVPVRHDPRKVGVSNYTFMRLVTHAFGLITGFSLLPLQVATFIGFFFTLVGVAVFLYVLLNYVIRGASVPGFTFLACMIAIFSGVQLFALGIFGEYLARIHFRTMERPVYLVRTQTGTCDHAQHS